MRQACCLVMLLWIGCSKCEPPKGDVKARSDAGVRRSQASEAELRERASAEARKPQSYWPEHHRIPIDRGEADMTYAGRACGALALADHETPPDLVPLAIRRCVAEGFTWSLARAHPGEGIVCRLDGPPAHDALLCTAEAQACDLETLKSWMAGVGQVLRIRGVQELRCTALDGLIVRYPTPRR